MMSTVFGFFSHVICLAWNKKKLSFGLARRSFKAWFIVIMKTLVLKQLFKIGHRSHMGHSTKLGHDLWRHPRYICEPAAFIIPYLMGHIQLLFKWECNQCVPWTGRYSLANSEVTVKDNRWCQFTDVTGTPSQIVSELGGMTHIQCSCDHVTKFRSLDGGLILGVWFLLLAEKKADLGNKGSEMFTVADTKVG